MTFENKVIVTLHSDAKECLYTGDIVTGIITLDLPRDLKIDSLDMEVVGISKAQWSRFTPTIPYLKIYNDKKKVFYFKQNIITFVEYPQNLAAGVHCYPFNFALQSDLPSTFKDSIASVKYFIKIKSKPARIIRKNIPFNVIQNVNVNDSDDMLKPSTYEYQQSFRGSTIVKVCVKTYICFAHRQLIPFKVTIINEKKIKIEKIKIVLLQKLRYTVSSGHANEEKNVCQVVYKQMENTKVEVCHFNMEIPAHIPTSSVNSAEPMIDISYELKVECYFSYRLNLIKYIPVIVAAVPVIHYDFETGEDKISVDAK